MAGRCRLRDFRPAPCGHTYRGRAAFALAIRQRWRDMTCMQQGHNTHVRIHMVTNLAS